MKQLIGNQFDLDAATLIGNIEYQGDKESVMYYKESLYKTPQGKFYFVGEGGPGTRWGAAQEPGGPLLYGAGVQECSRSDARQWTEHFVGIRAARRAFGRSLWDMLPLVWRTL